ncbi:hypothetical protein BKA93DRAFT_713966, partial [Sparassis latifolia]
FPPQSLSHSDLTDFVRTWCEFMGPAALSEAPCVICGELVLISDLSTVPSHSLNLSVLSHFGEGVTRCEHHNSEDPVIELEGPILMGIDSPELRACTSCMKTVAHGDLPWQSLTNGLWLGDVPSELQQLNFIEKLIVAHYRHNYFVVQVNMGQRKLSANAVVFPQPVERLH